MLGLNPKTRGMPRAPPCRTCHQRVGAAPDHPGGLVPVCEWGPLVLTLLSPPRSLRTQQSPPSIAAYSRPAPSPPLGHQALPDLQAQRDVPAQPLPQFQHGESPWAEGCGCRTPSSSIPKKKKEKNNSFLPILLLLEPSQISPGLILGLFFTPTRCLLCP